MDQRPLLEYLIMVGPTVIFRRTAEDLVTYVSPNVERILGYAPEEAVDVPGFWRDHLHPDDREQFVAMGRQAFERHETELERDYRFLHKDGSFRWLLARAHIEYDEAGAPEALLGFAIDVTERKQAEAAIQEREAALRTILAASPDIITMIRPSGELAPASDAVRDILGYDPEEYARMDRMSLIHPDDRERVETSLRSLLQGGPPVVSRFRVAHADGHWVVLESHSQAITDADGRPNGVTAVARDVAESVALEEALRSAKEEAERAKHEAEAANSAKSEFLSRMSHELRTPLNAILGFAQLIDTNERSEEDRESVEQITRAGRHLLQLIDEVLDIARIEQGKVSLSIEPVSLADVVSEALDLVRPLAASAGIRIWAEDSGLDRHVLADRHRLKQVLMNLLSNAVKYNRKGGSATVAAEPSADGRIRIAVTDTGPGISAELMDRLFLPFERLGADRTEVEGTGIGLSISRRLVELMGGAIGASSEPERGSTFWVELDPVEAPEDQLERTEQKQPIPEATPAGGAEQTILYVEDNLSNLRLVERILARRPGTRLIATMQGGMAVDLAREHSPNLILLDVHLPDIDGDEVLKRLREDPDTRDIPVVTVSAEATKRKIERFLAAGARAYLTKPLDVEQFLAIVDEVLGDKRP